MVTAEEQKIANQVTSDDLEYWGMGKDSREDILRDLDGREGDEIRRKALLVGKISKYLKKGPFYDWKESHEMYQHIYTMVRRGWYVYNAYPGGDGVAVIYSKIKLPKSERVR